MTKVIAVRKGTIKKPKQKKKVFTREIWSDGTVVWNIPKKRRGIK